MPFLVPAQILGSQPDGPKLYLNEEHPLYSAISMFLVPDAGGDVHDLATGRIYPWGVNVGYREVDGLGWYQGGFSSWSGITGGNAVTPFLSGWCIEWYDVDVGAASTTCMFRNALFPSREWEFQVRNKTLDRLDFGMFDGITYSQQFSVPTGTLEGGTTRYVRLASTYSDSLTKYFVDGAHVGDITDTVDFGALNAEETWILASSLGSEHSTHLFAATRRPLTVEESLEVSRRPWDPYGIPITRGPSAPIYISTGAAPNTGTGAGTIPATTGAAAGEIVRVGTGAGTISPVEGAAAGTLGREGTGAGTIPATTGEAAGNIIGPIIGAAVGTISPATSASQGTLARSGTGAGTIPATTGAATGEIVRVGIAAGTIPAITGAATGSRKLTGVAAGTIAAITGLGSSSQVLIVGSATGEVPFPISLALGGDMSRASRLGKGQKNSSEALASKNGS